MARRVRLLAPLRPALGVCLGLLVGAAAATLAAGATAAVSWPIVEVSGGVLPVALGAPRAAFSSAARSQSTARSRSEARGPDRAGTALAPRADPVALAHRPPEERLHASVARTEQSEGPIRLRPIGVEPRPAPFASASALEVWQAWEQGRLGSVSYGKPNRGGLYGGVRLQSNDWMQVRMPQRSWVTEEVAGQLAAALELLHTTHPDAPPLQVGDGSTRRGGWLRPHRSHQSGRDLDLGLFYLDPDTWYAKGTRKNLDIELNWALVKALLAAADVEYVFVDRSIIEMMREHALERGDSKELVESVLESPTHRGAPVRHTWGHRTHFHVRFHSNRAQAAAKRLHPLLERWGKL